MPVRTALSVFMPPVDTAAASAGDGGGGAEAVRTPRRKAGARRTRGAPRTNGDAPGRETPPAQPVSVAPSPGWVLDAGFPFAPRDAKLGIALVSALLALYLVVSRSRRQTVRALAASEARLRAIFEDAGVGIVVQDERGAIRDANPAFEAIVGRPRDALRTLRLRDVVPAPHADDADRIPHLLYATSEARRVTLEQPFARPDGSVRRCVLTVSPAGADGTLVGLVQDVTRDRAVQAELEFRAFHDALTRLANRVRFRERVSAALAAAAGTPDGPTAVAVLLIDLDGFKLVNDTAGHAAGDALLVEVAQRLLNATRGCDVVARLGGDEFGVLLTNVRCDDDATAAADRIIAAVARPIPIDGTVARVGASVGIARGEPAGAGRADATAGPPVADVGPVEALLRDADLALYAAKARGRGQAVVFAPEMRAAVAGRLALEAALRRAVDQGEFRLAYQPVVDLATHALVGVEALVRWHPPGGEVVNPAAFIPAAEEMGLIVPIGRWVLVEACRQGAAWCAAEATDTAAGGRPPFRINVNVSGRQLARAEFVGEVEAALASSGLPPACLTLEITESAVVHHPEAARRKLDALKALGVDLAIDDFGTGYSALSYLRQFPIDVLKLDKSFVDEIALGGRPAALAAAIVSLGAGLGLRTVAEGVETPEQATQLRAMGCSYGQGHLFAAPLGPDDITAALAERAGIVARAAVPDAAPCPALPRFPGARDAVASPAAALELAAA